MGASLVTSIGSHNYCQFYHDMAMGKDHTNFLKLKAKALEKYQQYEKWVKIQRNTHIKCLGSNRVGKYLSNEFTKHLKDAGTLHHLTVHDSPQSNGSAERSHHTHLKRVRSMLIRSGLG